MLTKHRLSKASLLLSVILSVSLRLCAQTYDQKIAQAAALLQQNNFPSALAVFKDALLDTAHVGMYDLYYAARTAVHCNDYPLALRWMSDAQKKGLGLGSGELTAIKNDSTFKPLYGYRQWTELVRAMDEAYSEKTARDQQIAQAWTTGLDAHRISGAQGMPYHQPKPGYARYFSRADTVSVPYLVYVPASYKAQRPIRAIVYLHGGVAAQADFDDANPDIRTEPIFAVADSLNTLVIYPFAKKAFGWLDQRAAFEQVLTILDSASTCYHIDRHQVYMVGMSNGGTACFWFATHERTPFRGFLALSALPKLSIGEIDFTRISPTAPLYSVNAQDDEVFPYADVARIYNDKKSVAPGWHFLTLPLGSHGFIYGPNGAALLQQYLLKMLQ